MYLTVGYPKIMQTHDSIPIGSQPKIDRVSLSLPHEKFATSLSAKSSNQLPPPSISTNQASSHIGSA